MILHEKNSDLILYISQLQVAVFFFFGKGSRQDDCFMQITKALKNEVVWWKTKSLCLTAKLPDVPTSAFDRS